MRGTNVLFFVLRCIMWDSENTAIMVWGLQTKVRLYFDTNICCGLRQTSVYDVNFSEVYDKRIVFQEYPIEFGIFYYLSFLLV